MAVHDNRITTAKLANGVNVFVDGKLYIIRSVSAELMPPPDHVYVSPPWSERDGEAFARIDLA